jgi:hypothetical protein
MATSAGRIAPGVGEVKGSVGGMVPGVAGNGLTHPLLAKDARNGAPGADMAREGALVLIVGIFVGGLF